MFIGDEQSLPSVSRFVDRTGVAYFSGQIGTSTGAPAFGTYLAAIPVPQVPR